VAQGQLHAQLYPRCFGICREVHATAPTKLHVSIQGAAGGKIERDMDAGASSQRAVPEQFTLSGSQPLIVVITAP